MDAPRVIAEIGCNHKGQMEIALRMVEVAASCEVAGVKFQKRNPRELLTEKEYNSPHPVQYNSYGRTYGEHREMLELSLQQHRVLRDRCRQLGIMYSSSVWDITSATEIASIAPDFIKIPSAMNCCWELYNAIFAAYSGPVHVSFGMTTRDEEADIIEFFRKNDRLDNAVFYICTSSYPAENGEICLLDIPRLKRFLHDTPVGFSGHHKGIQLDAAAVALGAEWIERHFTLDRTWKGTDHAASLEMPGLHKLVRDAGIVAAAMQEKQAFSEQEQVQRRKLKKYFLAGDYSHVS